MAKNRQKRQGKLCDWVKQSNYAGVIDLHKKFFFNKPNDPIKFITHVMEIDHSTHDCMLEATMDNNTVEIAVISIKEELAEQLLEIVENIYKKDNS